MADGNPYSINQTAEPANQLDGELLKLTAKALVEARECPPTFLSTLFKWPGTPLLILMGVVGTAALWFLANESDLTSHWPIGFAAMTFGAMLRDIGVARRIAKVWPTQSYFIDWRTVESIRKRF